MVSGSRAAEREVTFRMMPSVNKPINLKSTHSPLTSSLLGLPYGMLNIKHKKELLRGLWVNLNV